jgi:hypothetical protein
MVESMSEHSRWLEACGAVILTGLAVAAWRCARRRLPADRPLWRSLAVVLSVNGLGVAEHAAHPLIPDVIRDLFGLGRLAAAAIVALGLVWGLGFWELSRRNARAASGRRRGFALIAFGIVAAALPSLVSGALPPMGRLAAGAYLTTVGLLGAGFALSVTSQEGQRRFPSYCPRHAGRTGTIAQNPLQSHRATTSLRTWRRVTGFHHPSRRQK